MSTDLPYAGIYLFTYPVMLCCVFVYRWPTTGRFYE